MFSIYRILIILLVFLVGGGSAYSQGAITPAGAIAAADSLAVSADSTMMADSVARKPNALTAPVNYQAADSIVMTANNWAYLYGEGNVKYQQIELQSELIEMNMDSSLVFAQFGLDSIGEEFGFPLFKDGDQQYESKTMRYNFGSKKGYITDVITQQGEGYVTAGLTKKMDNDVLNMKGGQYTTCDEHDHPHFYIQMSKAKVRPNKNIVTGPVYLVIEDVPLYPLGLPFCFFPFSSSYSSGIIMPTFGDESTRGFFLRDGGYYFALSDYMDLAVTGEIYTKGSWGLSARSAYKKRYKYSGNFNASYLVTQLGDKGLPDYSLAKDFKINWTHSQDPKANPFRTFSGSINFATSSFDRNNTSSQYPGSQGFADRTQNTKSSSVSISQRFPNNPFSLSATMSINQTTRDSGIAVTLPDVSITMSRIYPFKRKNAIGDEHWYEKISMSYTGYFRNSISTKENLLFKSNIIKDWKNSMKHTIPVSMTFPVFKYLNISPSATYNESWYTSKVEQGYDYERKSMVARDTTYGFYRVFNYNAAVSASTTLYGFFKPLPFLGNKVEMIRHRFEPSVSLSMAPDFGAPIYGYYQNYSYTDANGNAMEYNYSPFENAPGRGKQGSLSLNLDNNIEMKIRTDKDSTGFRKISLIDKLSFGISHNLAADSFKWSDMTVGLRLKLSKSYTLNLTGMFDTYTYNDEGRKVDIPRWETGKGFGRLRSTSTSFAYTFNNDTFGKLFGQKGDKKTEGETTTDSSTGNPLDPADDSSDATDATKEGGRLRGSKKETGETDADGYMVAKVPWSLSFNYGLSLGYGEFNKKKREYDYKLTHALSFNGNIQPTKYWRFNFNATYDFDVKKISYMTCNITRDLHCFQMTASFVPVGPYKSYTFSIAVSSSLLKDLKYNQSSNYRDGQTWY